MWPLNILYYGGCFTYSNMQSVFSSSKVDEHNISQTWVVAFEGSDNVIKCP